MRIMLQRFEMNKNRVLTDWVNHCENRNILLAKKKAIFSIGDVKEREKQMNLLKSSIANQEKAEKKTFEEYLELILELGEYTRMNQLLKNELTKILMEEVKTLKDCILTSGEDKDYPAETFLKKCTTEFRKMCNNLNVKR